jgi:hypothetical protein
MSIVTVKTDSLVRGESKTNKDSQIRDSIHAVLLSKHLKMELIKRRFSSNQSRGRMATNLILAKPAIKVLNHGCSFRLKKGGGNWGTTRTVKSMPKPTRNMNIAESVDKDMPDCSNQCVTTESLNASCTDLP